MPEEIAKLLQQDLAIEVQKRNARNAIKSENRVIIGHLDKQSRGSPTTKTTHYSAALGDQSSTREGQNTRCLST